MPARLVKILRVNGEYMLRLYSKEPDVYHQYAALSYSWGGEQLLRTTKDNLENHYKEIKMSSLPPTLRDVVLTIDTLALEYLWVDALCIIQDDDHDRGPEIDMMSYVYSSATVTIIASRANGVYEGFLQDRPTYIFDNPNAFKMRFNCPNGLKGSLILVSAQKMTDSYDQRFSSSKEPLSRRGWALQERLASCLILDYGTHRTFWLCRAVCTSDRNISAHDDHQLKGLWDDQFMGLGPTDLPCAVTKLGPESSFNPETPLTLLSQEILAGLKKWNETVKEFTNKQLTFQSDRLSAIAGIARRYQPIFQDDYLAGNLEVSTSIRASLGCSFPSKPYPRA